MKIQCVNIKCQGCVNKIQESLGQKFPTLKVDIPSQSVEVDANEEELKYYLGLKKGSVTPLGILNDVHAKVKVIIDKDIKKLEYIY